MSRKKKCAEAEELPRLRAEEEERKEEEERARKLAEEQHKRKKERAKPATRYGRQELHVADGAAGSAPETDAKAA